MAVEKQSATEPLSEYCTNVGVKPRIDKDNGILFGVKLLGTQSKNKGSKHYSYPPSTLVKIAPVYEGAVSNVDHHENGEKVSYRDRIGIFRNVVARDDGLYGDFHFNPKHALAEQLCWDAEHAPEKLGFSHLADGKINRSKPGSPVVEDICNLKSVDLVANPASTSGLFESADEEITDPILRHIAEHCFSAMSDIRSNLLRENVSVQDKCDELRKQLYAWSAAVKGSGITTPIKENCVMDYKEVTLEGLKENCPEIVAKLTGTDETSKLTAEVKALTESVAAKDAAIKEATDKLAAADAEKLAQAKSLAISEELKAAKLDASDKVAVSEAFMAQLSEAKDETVRKALIEDRKAILGRTAKAPGVHPFANVGGIPTAPKTKKELLERL